ncbi:MAG: hypothetical protein ABR499_21405 [Gemmatimonadaceae bacterium]
MFSLLALRSLTDRPWRSLFLLLGYSTGVGVMIVLLSIGEALIGQARDERLVGGGEVTVLPEGLDVEVMKTGGLGGLFFSIDHARFIYRQLLASPRLSDDVVAVAPQIEGKLLYVRTADGAERPVRASGEIPSRTAAVGAGASLVEGRWADDDGDRRWRDPTPFELRHEMDRFHLPPARAGGAPDESWAEWHYFNVVSADRRRWAFISFIVAGAIPSDAAPTDRWGAQVLVTLHEQGRPARRFATAVPSSAVRFSTSSADLSIGESRVTVLPDGRYEVRARAAEDGRGASVDVDLIVAPTPRAYFPGAALSGGEFTSGYVVPALRADGSGRVCAPGWCERFERVQAYHDHNWGVWRGVTWEWGAARTGDYALLFGRVEPPDSVAAAQPLFLYLVDSLGFVALFRPREVAYDDGRVVTVDGGPVRVPTRGVMVDVRGGDTLRIDLEVEDAAVTDTRKPLIERGDAGAARMIRRPYFVQMKGLARISGRVGGRRLVGEGTGFFETYR